MAVRVRTKPRDDEKSRPSAYSVEPDAGPAVLADPAGEAELLRKLAAERQEEAEFDALAMSMLEELQADISDPEALEMWLTSLARGEVALTELKKYKIPPVGIREFIESPQYMNKPGIVWPILLDELEAMNSGQYIEAVLTGAIGSGKTTMALYSQIYQLYLLSCLRNPHGEFGLDPASEIVVIFQSITKELAKSVDYARFREMVEQSPYFVSNFIFDKEIESQLNFPNRIVVKPVAGGDTAAIGQNVIGGIIDELNFMKQTEGSKQAKDGGTYDQAVSNYNSLARRRESRFAKMGKLPGLVCLVSSRNFPGQFTDLKEAEAKRQIREHGSTRIFVFDKRGWQVKPPGSFSGEMFRVYLGDAVTKPRILAADEKVRESEEALVDLIPIEHLNAFQEDLLAAIRDIAGVATYAIMPFIPNPERITAAFGRVRSVMSREDCDFVESFVQFYPKLFIRPLEPRFVHVDLALTGDSAGVACGFVPEFRKMDRDGIIEVAPVIQYDFVLEVKPPRNDEINFAKIRTLIYKLREHGLNIKWAGLDSFQSRDFIQALRAKNFAADLLSLDKTPVPYAFFKSAILDSRLLAPTHKRARDEVLRLERDALTGKIDHPPSGSKDCSDAMCGVAYGLSTRRDIWARHGVLRAAPVGVQRQAEQETIRKTG